MKNGDEQIRLGIIGIGNMGSEHCRTILEGQCPEVCLAAVADPREERREWARQEDLALQPAHSLALNSSPA